MDTADVIRLLRDFAKTITRIAQASDAVHEAALDLAGLLEELEPELARAVAAVPWSPGASTALSLFLTKMRAALARVLPEPAIPRARRRYEPEPDVSVKLVEVKRPGGSAIVIIDGVKLAVPPALGDLVSELIDDGGGVSPDELVPFKRVSDLLLKLQRRRHDRPLKTHTLNQQVYSLRDLLHKRGFSRNLVQTRRGAGVRFALKRRGPELAAQDLMG
jgi:hypothetical protein